MKNIAITLCLILGFATVSLAQAAEQAPAQTKTEVKATAPANGGAATTTKEHCGDKANMKSCCSKGGAQMGCGEAHAQKSCCSKGGQSQAALKEDDDKK